MVISGGVVQEKDPGAGFRSENLKEQSAKKRLILEDSVGM